MVSLEYLQIQYVLNLLSPCPGTCVCTCGSALFGAGPVLSLSGPHARLTFGDSAVLWKGARLPGKPGIFNGQSFA